ncbi:MAG TPA: hypothetical protein VMR21_13190 [Vicinamibacteria bacterium]|nr:hypothetical protein [Vicinamibacteria bacterium]
MPGPTRGLRDAEHLIRVAVLFVAGVIGFAVVQRLLVPEGFGELGHYRTGALADNRSRPVVFAGGAACQECHSDVAETKARGGHARPSCEACHGALARHAADPEVKPVRPDGRTLCMRCHAVLVGRPGAFPQVDVDDHAGEATCTECHAAHDPLPGGAP